MTERLVGVPPEPVGPYSEWSPDSRNRQNERRTKRKDTVKKTAAGAGRAVKEGGVFLASAAKTEAATELRAHQVRGSRRAQLGDRSPTFWFLCAVAVFLVFRGCSGGGSDTTVTPLRAPAESVPARAVPIPTIPTDPTIPPQVVVIDLREVGK